MSVNKIVYVAILKLNGYGIVDLVERPDCIRGLDAFDVLTNEAENDDFGEGVYEVLLLRETLDANGNLIKSRQVKRAIIDRGDEI